MSRDIVNAGGWLCLYDMISGNIVAYAPNNEENSKRMLDDVKAGFKNGYIIIGIRDFDKMEQQCKMVIKAMLRRIAE